MIYIIKSNDANKIDYELCQETNLETLQYSKDGLKTYITSSNPECLGDITPLEIHQNYDFTRTEEWWVDSNYESVL
jgi:hypothetical protein